MFLGSQNPEGGICVITPELYAGKSSSGELIFLDPPKTAEANKPFQLVSNPERMEHFMLGRPPFQLDELEDYSLLVQRVIEHPARWAWWICTHNMFVGLVATMEAKPDDNIGGRISAKIYYVVDKQWEGRDIATQAVKRAITYLLGETGLEAVEVQILTHNTASLRVAEKLGFGHHRTVAEEYEDPNGQRFDVWHGYKFRPS